jgi:hypothetical protein
MRSDEEARRPDWQRKQEPMTAIEAQIAEEVEALRAVLAESIA